MTDRALLCFSDHSCSFLAKDHENAKFLKLLRRDRRGRGCRVGRAGVLPPDRLPRRGQLCRARRGACDATISGAAGTATATTASARPSVLLARQPRAGVPQGGRALGPLAAYRRRPAARRPATSRPATRRQGGRRSHAGKYSLSPCLPSAGAASSRPPPRGAGHQPRNVALTRSPTRRFRHGLALRPAPRPLSARSNSQLFERAVRTPHGAAIHFPDAGPDQGLPRRPKKIFENIWLSFYPDAKIGVVGVNGSGKSTLLKIMAGIDKEFTGEANAADGVKRGYLEQEPQLDDKLDVWGNVIAWCEEKKLFDRLQRRRRQAGRGLHRRADGGDDRAPGEDRRRRPVGHRQPHRDGHGRPALPAQRLAGRQAVGRRAAPRRAGAAAALQARHAAAGRAHQPPGRRERGLAAAPPGEPSRAA